MFELPGFCDSLLLLQALTHHSYVNEDSKAGEDNERLEFLGDAILGFVVSAILYQHYPGLSEGELTQRRSRLVDQPQLAQVATALNLGRQIRVGEGMEKEGGRQNPSLLSSAFEAVIGAYFLDAGIEAVQEYVKELFQPLIDKMGTRSLLDPKSQFQQWALANLGPENPTYVVIAESGPDHAKRFTVAVKVGDIVYGVGTDRSKREAGKRAAEDALNQLNLE